MSHFSAWSVFWNGMTGQTGWTRQWRDPEPKAEYDVLIVGGGLHGLATAYYLAVNWRAKLSRFWGDWRCKLVTLFV